MPVTATFSARVPAAGATFVTPDGWHEIVVTPGSPLNGIDEVVLTHNGIDFVAELFALGPSGATLARARGYGLPNSTNDVEWTATTIDANPNVDAYSYTTRPTFPPSRAAVDHAPAPPVAKRATIDHAPSPPPHTRAAVDSGVLPTGYTSATRAAVDYGVSERTGGLLDATVAVVDYYATDPQIHAALPSGGVPGEQHHDPAPTGAAISGTDRQTAMPAGMAVFGTATEPTITSGATLDAPERHTVLTSAADTGEQHHDPAPTGASLQPVTGRLTVELSAVSTAKKTADTEED